MRARLNEHQDIRQKNPALLYFRKLAVVLMVLSGLYACSTDQREDETYSVDDKSAEQHASEVIDELSVMIAEDLNLSLWASEKLISDPVALHMDDKGRALVTVTERRRNAELDIRSHRDWMIESVGFETVEDRRDFIHRELSPERSDSNSSWLPDHNRDGTHDWRDLTVNKESVFRLEDRTGNGFANRSQLFIRDFNEEVTDVAGAVLHHQGELFLGVAPDLWRIRDNNADGYGEEKESVSHGYGVNIGFAGHGMSGLTVGPDGRIYWSIGDRGMSVDDKDGNKWHFPREGVIVRSEPDGSNFEVFASGLRNTHEFVFDKYGNLIAVDNDGDHAGESERLVYLVNGSDSGWRLNWQFGKYNDPKNNDYKVLMDEGYYKTRFDDQAAHLLPPLAYFHDGPAGMAYNPGTALGKRWEDHFFVSEFVGSATGSGIHAFTLKPAGASFELERDVQILKGILATGLDFGPDGALYFADWIDGWALNGEGRIWKLDSTTDAGSGGRTETERFLSENFNGRSSDDLLLLLGNKDMRVRKKAQFELASRDDIETFQEALNTDRQQLQRIHGIWGLAQIGRRIADAVTPLLPLLEDEDPEVRAQAAKMLGDVRYKPAGDLLIPLLKDDNPRVRYFATEALGRLSRRQALEPIVEMLEANNDKDIYLRHGGAIALAGIGDGEALTNLSGHPSKAVRIAAVVALKRLEHPGVVHFLDDEDEFIVTNAARAINDDGFIEEGMQALAEMLEQKRFNNEPLLRRAINANLYVGTEKAAGRLAGFAARGDIPESLRVEAINTLSVWPESSKLDRVTGDPRGIVNNDPDDARRGLNSVIVAVLSGRSGDLKIAALRAASSLQMKMVIPDITEMVNNDPIPLVRIAALESLVELEFEGIANSVFSALGDDAKEVRMNALRLIPDLNFSDEKMAAMIQSVLETGTIEERQTALTVLRSVDAPAANEILNRQMQLLISGELDPELELELVETASEARTETIKTKLNRFRAEKSDTDSVSAYREALYGGNAENGRRIFYRSESAQCIRCHAINGEGSSVGPDLTDAGNRLSRQELLRSMVDPAAGITPGYGTVSVTLQDGNKISGLLQEESGGSVTIVNGDEKTVIEKDRIMERTNSPSGMPAMGNRLTLRELRDLVEFLSALKDPEI